LDYRRCFFPIIKVSLITVITVVKSLPLTTVKAGNIFVREVLYFLISKLGKVPVKNFKEVMMNFYESNQVGSSSSSQCSSSAA